MGNTFNHILGLDISSDTDESSAVDFILAYDSEDMDPDKKEKRQVFETNLQLEGLVLDYDIEQNIHFVKIRATSDVLCRYAEILKFTFPLIFVPGQDLIYRKNLKLFHRLVHCCLSPLNKERLKPPKPRIFYEFSRRHAPLYDVDNPKFFDTGVRSNIVYFILQRQHFVKDAGSPLNMGIKKLLQDGVYLKAYPMHNSSQRRLLLREWASFRKFFTQQPLFAIFQYFGARVAIYYAWLGFYVFMLIPLSIFGLLCFIYGLSTLPTDAISHQICEEKSKVLMCPQCDIDCDYWELGSTCFNSKVNYLLDNSITVFFALGLSVWAVLYLEFWKQYSAVLVHNWGLTNFTLQVEHARPKYLSRLHGKKTLSFELNAENVLMEPVVPFWRYKFLPRFMSYSILVLFICVSLIAMFALIVYRMAQTASYSILGEHNSMTHKILVLPITAGLLDLVVITLLNFAYERLAVKLTNLEYYRTQTEYEENLTIKNYIFQFVNYYASLFYIAFWKNKFVGYPGKYNRIFGFRQQECNPGGCLMELCLQLVIIMVGKQALKSIVEILQPYVMVTLRFFCLFKKKGKVELICDSPWTKDYNLRQFTNDSLFKEYLSMVIQYGFVVIFGLAFPLAPLLALINNVFELRADAINFLKFMQRPVARRVRNIGVWYNIMEILTKIAVLVNAVIIAFSTNFIPKLVYVTETDDRDLNKFLNFTLAEFNTQDFESKPHIEESRYVNVTRCHYSDYRNPPGGEKPYMRPVYYWYIWIGRLAFIVVYQNVIGFLQAVVAYVVPDVPSKLLKRIKREEFLTREFIIEFERNSAVEKIQGPKGK